MNRPYLVLLSIIFLGCQSYTSDEREHCYSAQPDKHSIDKSRNDITNVIGIITTNEKLQFGDTIEIFDDSGKVIDNFILMDEKQILALKCLSKNDTSYRVRLQNNTEGIIPANEEGIILQTLEEHILSLFAVGFEPNNNPLLEKPFPDTNKMPTDQDEFYHPNKIEGDWLQVKWGDESHWDYGWVKWRSEGKLLIELFYFA